MPPPKNIALIVDSNKLNIVNVFQKVVIKPPIDKLGTNITEG